MNKEELIEAMSGNDGIEELDFVPIIYWNKDMKVCNWNMVVFEITYCANIETAKELSTRIDTLQHEDVSELRNALADKSFELFSEKYNK